MSREYAKNLFSAWTDDHFTINRIFDKLLYQVLLGQPPTLLNNAGVQPLSLRRWRKAMRDVDEDTGEVLTPSDDEIMAALYRLESREYVFVDEDTGEVLVRAWMRRDGVARQPTMFMSALRSAALVESPKLAGVLLQELTERIKLPEITGDSPYSTKLQRSINAAMETTLTHLRNLSAKATGPTTGGSIRPTIGGSVKAQDGGGSTGGSTGGSSGPPVVVEVEVVTNPSNYSRGEGRPGRPKCSKHPQGNANDDPCRGCQQVRTWDADALAQALAAHANAETERRREAVRAIAQAIAACPLCDGDGYRGAAVCDHTDHTETNRRGAAAVKAALKAANYA